MNLNSLKISTRLALGFGMLALLIALMGLLSLVKTNTINEEVSLLIHDRIEKVVELHEAKGEINQVARSTRDMVIMTNPADIAKEVEIVANTRKAIASRLDKLIQSIRSDAGKAAVANLLQVRSKYTEQLNKFMELAAANKREEAEAHLLTNMRPAQLVYFDALDVLLKHQDQSMEQSAKVVMDTVTSIRTLMAVAVVIALVFATWVAVGITRSVTRPINQAIAILRSIASGDLSVKFEAQGHNETAQLLHALKATQSSLINIVSQVRSGSGAMATATSQIAAGNLDLSSRTEEQASALEQTAASMEELASTVKQNFASGKHANQLAESASQVAVQGGAVVAQVVHTMEAINVSSKKIADIIGVIDGIAFQTNILALNAAVEAARAGEQGRGFAVVASEVRSLAGRSATAAKEIKELIGASVDNVTLGCKLVEQAGSTMDEIVVSVRRVTDIMGEISTASQDQSAGIDQINQAMTQMDQVTQQNAALVEEAAAAAQALEQQAQNMEQVVSIFKLGQQGGLGLSYDTLALTH